MDKPLILVHPNAKWEGCLTAVSAGRENIERLAALERDAAKRKFRVRAVVADSLPLRGEPPDLLGLRPFPSIRLSEDPLILHLHRGGRNVWFFTLKSDGTDDRLLACVEVTVQTRYPRSALRLARTAISVFLDTLAINWNLPATIARLDLLIDGSDEVIVSELVLPYSSRLVVGPLGGFDQSPLFTPWLAVLREATTATSPFWRLLCAWRAYDGVRHLRRTVKEVAERFGVSERMPKDPEINIEVLRSAGIDPAFLVGIRRGSDLFAKMTTMRDGVAHFLLDTGQHVDFSDGTLYAEYSIASAVLLQTATQAINDLHGFYARNIEQRTRIGSIMPDKDQSDDYPVRDPDESSTS